MQHKSTELLINGTSRHHNSSSILVGHSRHAIKIYFVVTFFFTCISNILSLELTCMSSPWSLKRLQVLTQSTKLEFPKHLFKNGCDLICIALLWTFVWLWVGYDGFCAYDFLMTFWWVLFFLMTFSYFVRQAVCLNAQGHQHSKLQNYMITCLDTHTQKYTHQRIFF